MLKKAVILLPGRPDSPAGLGKPTPLLRVGGLTWIQRTVYTAQWSGVQEGIILSRGDWPEVDRQILEDPKNRAFLCVSLVPGTEAGRNVKRLKEFLQEDLLVFFPSWIVDRQILRALCGTEGPLAGPIAVGDRQQRAADRAKGLPALALLPGSRNPDLVEALQAADPVEAFGRLLKNLPAVEERLLGEPGLIRAESQADLAKAERLLFQSLIKPTESFLSKNFERKVSLAITRRLLNSRITPNQISIFSILLGLASGLLFLGEHRLTHVSGALLLLFSSIVDGCDGEVARLKFQESRLGSLLDFLGDNLVHVTVFFCIGLGLFRRGEGSVYLGLGILAALGTFASAFAVFRRVFHGNGSAIITFSTPVRGEEMDRAKGRLRRQIEFADKISNRDFIYLILGLAALGGLWIYAWLSALGSMFYFFYLLYLYRRMGRLSRVSPSSDA